MFEWCSLLFCSLSVPFSYVFFQLSFLSIILCSETDRFWFHVFGLYDMICQTGYYSSTIFICIVQNSVKLPNSILKYVQSLYSVSLQCVYRKISPKLEKPITQYSDLGSLSFWCRQTHTLLKCLFSCTELLHFSSKFMCITSFCILCFPALRENKQHFR